MEYLPIFADIRGRRCLVVGGGPVAARKASVLVHAGAQVTVVAPEFCAAVRELGEDGDAHLIERAFDEDDLQGLRLVVVATDEGAANISIAAAARARGVWINAVDDPANCDFVMPAIVDRDPLLVAISSGGRSPVLARLMRARVEAMLPHRLGELAVLLGSYRDRVKARFTTVDGRRRFWEGVLDGPVAELAERGDAAGAARALERAVETATDESALGCVYVVAMGSDDPDDLSFRKLRLLQRAELVVHGADLPAALLGLARRDAERERLPCTDGELDVALVAGRLGELAASGVRVCWLTRAQPQGVLARLGEAEFRVVQG